MSIYDYVKILANERKIAISEVEKCTGLGNGTIKSWETSFPKVDKLYGVAQYFGVNLEYFLTGKRPEQDEFDLLTYFRECDRDGKRVIMGHAVEEYRRTEKEKTDSTKESAAG